MENQDFIEHCFHDMYLNKKARKNKHLSCTSGDLVKMYMNY